MLNLETIISSAAIASIMSGLFVIFNDFLRRGAKIIWNDPSKNLELYLIKIKEIWERI